MIKRHDRKNKKAEKRQLESVKRDTEEMEDTKG
jgi:hypothetical protein